MKSIRIHKLQTWTIIVLIAYTLLALVVYKAVPPNSARLILESSNVSESIQKQDAQGLRSNLSAAVVRLHALRQDKDELQIIFYAATAGVVGFGIWSLYMVGRIGREDLIDQAT